MNRAALTDILALGALTGMRSMAGPATLAFRQGGPLRSIAGVLAAGEMVLDKAPFIGDRIERAPLLGRAAMGALAGGLIAKKAGPHVYAGAALGAAAAVAMAHIAFRARRGLPVPGIVGGLLEDALVVGAGAMLTRHR
jgi:uncharacterized membrane protein